MEAVAATFLAATVIHTQADGASINKKIIGVAMSARNGNWNTAPMRGKIYFRYVLHIDMSSIVWNRFVIQTLYHQVRFSLGKKEKVCDWKYLGGCLCRWTLRPFDGSGCDGELSQF